MDLVQVIDSGPIRTVRMNRPDKKNALTFEMYDAMAAGFAGAQENSELRCILLAGSPNDFCAGNDIGNFAQTATSTDPALRKPVINFLHAIAQSDKPIVAAVQGNAVGIGATMLLHCDYVIASTDARFSMPFVALGILPEAGSTLIVPRLLGHARAFELLVMGRPLDAEAAKDAGLINSIVPAETVESEAMKAAQAIAALPPQGVLTARRLMRGERSEIIERMDHEAALIGERLKSAEARTAFEAFLNRKKA